MKLMILHYNRNMKSKTIVLMMAVLAMLPGCGALKQAAAPVQSSHATAPPRPMVAKSTLLLKEANRLAEKVRNGEMTRLEAADQLNLVRLRLVGANRIDDSTFSTYRFLVLHREDGSMTQEESHSRMEMKLREWQQRWPQLARRPADPAFTNFLMQLYGMPPLK